MNKVFVLQLRSRREVIGRNRRFEPPGWLMAPMQMRAERMSLRLTRPFRAVRAAKSRLRVPAKNRLKIGREWRLETRTLAAA